MSPLTSSLWAAARVACSWRRAWPSRGVRTRCLRRARAHRRSGPLHRRAVGRQLRPLRPAAQRHAQSADRRCGSSRRAGFRSTTRRRRRSRRSSIGRRSIARWRIGRIAAGAEIRVGARVSALEADAAGVQRAPSAATSCRRGWSVLACGANYAFQRRFGFGLPRTYLHTAQRELPAGGSRDVELHFGQRRRARRVRVGGAGRAAATGSYVRVGVMASRDALGCYERMLERVGDRWGVDEPSSCRRARRSCRSARSTALTATGCSRSAMPRAWSSRRRAAASTTASSAPRLAADVARRRRSQAIASTRQSLAVYERALARPSSATSSWRSTSCATWSPR